MTGKEIERCLLLGAEKNPNITILENHIAIDLLIASKTAQFNNEEKVLLGTNKHPNPNDKMKDELELFPFVKTNKRKTLIQPIIENRLAETIEQNRLKTE